MLEQLLIDHCAPTLAGLKAASLFRCLGMEERYPLGDVKEFIRNRGKNSKCTGCWKVYCDECEARKIFARYEKCRCVYQRLQSWLWKV